MAFEKVADQKNQQTSYQRSQTFDSGPDRGGGIERVTKSKRKKQTAAKAKKVIDKEQALRKLVADNPYDIRIPSGRIPRGIPYAVPINFGLNISSPSRQRRLNESVRYFDALKKISEKDITGRYTKDAEGYENYIKDRLAGIIDASGNRLDSRGDAPLIYDEYMDTQIIRKTPQGIMTQNIMEEEKSPTPQDFTQRIIYDAYGAKDGGRIGFQVGGGADMGTVATPTRPANEALVRNLQASGPAAVDMSNPDQDANQMLIKQGNIPVSRTSKILGGMKRLKGPAQAAFTTFFLPQLTGAQKAAKIQRGIAAARGINELRDTLKDVGIIPGLGQMPEDELPTRMDSPDDITDSFEVADLTNLQKKMLDKRKPMIDAIGIEGVHDSIKQFDDDNNPSTLEDVKQYYQMAANGGRIGAAFGGIMDTATGRKAYGLGSLFKSIKKATKKVLGSDLGKAVLFAGLGSYGLGIGPFKKGSEMFGGKFAEATGSGFLKSGAKKLFMGGGDYDDDEFNPFKSLMAISAVPFAAKALNIGQPKEETLGGGGGGGRLIDPLTNEEVTPAQLRSNLSMAIEDAGDDPVKIAAINEAYPFLNLGDYLPYPTYGVKDGGRIPAQEGGLMDLGGMEKDYRNEGGFVAIGGEERADDVPARLSRNEFVFTADAVRGAGGGDIDKGAEIMENVMKNLEQGGKISEESQGNTGAQEMFSVSERIGEVL